MVKENYFNLTGEYGYMHSIEPAAKCLNISKKTVYKLIQKEELRQSVWGVHKCWE